MPIAPKLVTIDWDETLADTRSCVVSAMEKVLAHYGMEPWDSTKAKRRDTSKSFEENFPNFFADKAQEAYNRYLSEYRALRSSAIIPKRGAEIFLRLLEKKRILIGIISNKEQSLLMEEIDALFPKINFACVYGNYAAGKNKPDPAPIIMACDRLGVEICDENVWHVGDSKLDVDCALNAQVTPVLVGKGKFFTEKDKSTSLLRFEHLEALSEYLGGIYARH